MKDVQRNKAWYHCENTLIITKHSRMLDLTWKLNFTYEISDMMRDTKILNSRDKIAIYALFEIVFSCYKI